MLALFDCLSRWTGIRCLPKQLPYAEGPEECTLDIPGFQQVDSFSCGAIAGYTIVATFHPEVTFDDFYEVLSPRPKAGVSSNKLVRTLNQFGIGTRFSRRLSFGAVVTSIDDGLPIIVGRLTEYNQDHWAVLYGYGTDPQRVFLSGRSANPLMSSVMEWTAFHSSFMAVRGPAIKCWGE